MRFNKAFVDIFNGNFSVDAFSTGDFIAYTTVGDPLVPDLIILQPTIVPLIKDYPFCTLIIQPG
jgi:hypothetical protein